MRIDELEIGAVVDWHRLWVGVNWRRFSPRGTVGQETHWMFCVCPFPCVAFSIGFRVRYAVETTWVAKGMKKR